MTTQNSCCPPESVLGDFGLGKLDAAAEETVSQHLETCIACRDRVADWPSDNFLKLLREARGAVIDDSLSNATGSTDGSPSPLRMASNSPASGNGVFRPHPSSGDDGASAPAELRNHPDYDLIEEIGRGGMGTVYLARNRIMDRLEVLKVVSPLFLGRATALERFQQEIRSAAKLNHPNIVAAYSVLRTGDSLVLAMEYVRGEDLAQVVKSQGRLPIANAACYVHQSALGLQHAHEKGMVHRDIKPNNLMLSVEGTEHVVKILDFGLSKATSEKGAETSLTKSGQLLGTPDYVAPEQMLNAQKADIRADIYSLGCTLYFLLSGRPPFQEPSLYEVLDAHQKREARPLNLVRPDVPVEFAAIAAKMMAKDPAQRFQTPVEAARALAPFFESGVAPVGAGNLGSGALDIATRVATAAEYDVPPKQLSTCSESLPIASPPALAAMTPAKASNGSQDATNKSPIAKRRMRRPRRATVVGLLLLSGLALAGVLLRFKTDDGVVVLNVNVEKPQIFIDGNRAQVAWDEGGKRAEISVQPGNRKIQVKKDGFSAFGKEVSLAEGDRRILTATLERKAGKPKGSVQQRAEPSKAGELKKFPCEIPLLDRSAWSIEGDELVQNSLNPDVYMFFGDPNWTDYDFSFDAKPVEGWGLRTFFRYRDDQNYYSYVMGAFKNTWQMVDILDHGKFGDRLTQGALKLSQDRWHRVEIKVRGAIGRCLLDGQNVLQEFSLAQYGRGRVGWTTDDGARLRFRNISVKDPEGNVLLQGLPDIGRARRPDEKLAGDDSIVSPAQPTDLLGLVRLPDDALEGVWQRTEQGLQSEGDSRAKLRFRCRPPDEYDLRLAFSRVEGAEWDVNSKDKTAAGMALILCRGDARFAWWLGLYGNKVCGVASVNGYFAASNSTTFRRDPMFENGRKYRALIQVRNDSISTYLDDVQVGQTLKTDYSNVSLGLDSSVGRNLIGIIAACPFIIHEAEIRPVSQAAEAVSAGSIWKGTRTFRRGKFSPSTVNYELNVRERNGRKFAGNAFDNGPNRNRAEVEGEIEGSTLAWRERWGYSAAVVTAEGTVVGDAIKLTFKGSYSADGTDVGDGELSREGRKP